MEDGDIQLEQLASRVRDGDRDALAAAFAQCEPRLLRTVELRMDARLRGRLSPRDVLQEAWLDVERRIAHFADTADMPLFLWLRWVVNQTLIEIHRRHLGAVKRSVGLEVSLPNRPAAGDSLTRSLARRIAADMTSPSQRAARHEVVELLEAAINQMEPLDREVLALRHFEELTNGEAALALGLHKGTASKRYVRALSRLREALAHLSEPDDEPS